MSWADVTATDIAWVRGYLASLTDDLRELQTWLGLKGTDDGRPPPS